MNTCTRRLEWDMGHRVPLHSGKCRSPHGHRYAAEVTCRASALTPEGFVVDFGVVKQLLGGWIDDHLDHAFSVQERDPLESALRGVDAKLFIMRDAPTAEHLAALLLERGRNLLFSQNVEVVRVRVYETPNCWADAE
jgi:6-pyruvoyltetrahydropterin/6-carboxytetrahydropterin synthase